MNITLDDLFRADLDNVDDTNRRFTAADIFRNCWRIRDQTVAQYADYVPSKSAKPLHKSNFGNFLMAVAIATLFTGLIVVVPIALILKTDFQVVFGDHGIEWIMFAIVAGVIGGMIARENTTSP